VATSLQNSVFSGIVALNINSVNSIIMKKTYIFIAVIALIFSIGLVAPVAALAQYTTYVQPYTTSYVPTNTYGNAYATYAGACTNLTSSLYKGLSDVTTGGQVSALQSFLISQGYLTIVAPTGYFGALTSQAVSRYQYAHELPSNGTVDTATRVSIQTVSCGNNYGYNNNNNYNNYNNGYTNYYSAPVISSLSASSGYVGNSVTIYGSGFDLYNNTVNFNGVTLSNIPSYNGVALAFVVPQVYGQNYNNYNYNYNSGYNTTGTYYVSVTTSRGTSNSLPFTITSGNNYCYNNGYNYNNNYNNCYNYGNSTLSVSNVTGPTTLNTWAQGNWSLTLYNPNSNYVSVSARWGDENTYGYAYTSQQATQSSYVQGQQTITFNHTYQNSGYYTVVFTATDNQGTQTSVSATVRVSGSTYNQGQPYVSSISPSSARTGTQIVIYGSNFSSSGNTVHFGSGGAKNLISLSSGGIIYYTIPYTASACDVATGGTACAMLAQQITPGTYPIYVSNSYGQSNTIYFTVTY
jgi:hypothetical protein